MDMKVPNAGADVSASDAQARAPGRFRALVRREEIALAILAALAAAAGCVAVMYVCPPLPPFFSPRSLTGRNCHRAIRYVSQFSE